MGKERDGNRTAAVRRAMANGNAQTRATPTARPAREGKAQAS